MKHVALVAAVLVIGASASASAVEVRYSWVETDWSSNSADGHTVTACDSTYNGAVAEAQAYFNGSETRYTARDTTVNGACAAVTLGSKVIYRHRIVQDKVFDTVGAWVYPS